MRNYREFLESMKKPLIDYALLTGLGLFALTPAMFIVKEEHYRKTREATETSYLPQLNERAEEMNRDESIDRMKVKYFFKRD